MPRFWGYHYRAIGQQKYARWISAFRELSIRPMDVRNRLRTMAVGRMGKIFEEISGRDIFMLPFMLEIAIYFLVNKFQITLDFLHKYAVIFRGYIAHRPAQWLVF